MRPTTPYGNKRTEGRSNSWLDLGTVRAHGVRRTLAGNRTAFRSFGNDTHDCRRENRPNKSLTSRNELLRLWGDVVADIALNVGF